MKTLKILGYALLGIVGLLVLFYLVLLAINLALAGAALLTYFEQPDADRASRAIYESVFEAIYDNVKTADLGGHATTTEFTDDVIHRVKSKLEVWTALA